MGSDLRQGILTLPTIMLLERYPDDNPIRDLFEDRSADAPLERALEMINGSTILADCNAEVQKYCAAAAAELTSLPDCPARRSLQSLTNYAQQRRR